LICEDSNAYATALSRFLRSDPAIEVVGVAATGEQAIAEVERLRPDLLTLDMQLPGIDGLDVVRALMGTTPLPIVVLSSHVPRGSERAAAALAAGALDVVSKETLRLDRCDDVWAQAMRSRLRRLSSIRVTRGAPVRAARPRRSAPVHVARAVGIGASTGGPPVLEEVLSGLQAEYEVPVLVVQHIARDSSTGSSAGSTASSRCPSVSPRRASTRARACGSLPTMRTCCWTSRCGFSSIARPAPRTGRRLTCCWAAWRRASERRPSAWCSPGWARTEPTGQPRFGAPAGS
jgi:chemotaxis response regulator CheB